MSGGFFRGTSADQDTRFSNKQAKLLKSQKFAPELENLVDMSKVKVDVIRPWIAKRVTELIGFEDEVLINFIYGLLEGKAVNGKEIQISLTGFMERNTGKFMKELWSLLLSAQQNVSGVPQQFLDAKEEETKKKKAETECIANEIHRNKEKEKLEAEQEKTRMGGEDSISRDRRLELEIDIKNDGRESTVDKEQIKRSGRRGHRDSQSPESAHRSPSRLRKYSASPSKSSNPRSDSERERSHSTSGAASSRSRSISSERNRRLGRERSATPPRRRYSRRSPSPRHTSLRARRSTSRSRYRSPSPPCHRIRSPLRWRSRTPIRRRSRSPIRRRSRSPIRRRSRSPIRRRSLSPVRGRSRSHVRPKSRTAIRRSPVRCRSRTPIRRRSPSPVRRRSPSPVRRRSPSPVRRRSPYCIRHRSPSPSPSFVSRRSQSLANSSPSPTWHSSPSLHGPSFPAQRQYRRSPSTLRQQSISPARGRSSLRGRKRSVTPVHQRSPAKEEFSSPSHAHRGSLSPIRKESMKNGRSPMQSSRERTRRHDNYSSVHRGSSYGRDEPPVESKGVRTAESKLPIVSLRSPQRDTCDQDDLPGKNRDLSSPVPKSPFVSHVSRSTSYSDERRSTSPRSSHGTRAHGDGTKLEKTQPTSSDKLSDRAYHKKHHSNQELPITSKAPGLSVKGRESCDDDGARAKQKKLSRADDNNKSSYNFTQQESLPKHSRKSECNNQNGSFYSPSKETNEGKVKEKRKHRKSNSQEEKSDSYSSYDSYEDKKVAKRRRKEEKKVKKEKRRRRKEERRRRREERHAEKLKLRSGDSDSSSLDLEQQHSEEYSVRMQKSQASNIQETESEQKRLEIELREKALETLRAKKGLGN